jgi:hypothetical protein
MSVVCSSIFSWIFGPRVLFEDCLAAFFSADELKGTVHSRSFGYTRKNAQVVTNLQQTCYNAVAAMYSHSCSQLVDKLSTACWQLATRLLSSADLLQVVPMTCYRPGIQQFVNKLRVTTL